MFGSLFGSNDKKDTKNEVTKEKTTIESLAEEMKSWTLTEIRDYMSGNREDMKRSADGMTAIVYRFVNFRTEDKNYPEGKKEMEITDLPQRTQKVIEIVVAICKGAYIDMRTIGEITKFVELYNDFFARFDSKNKTNYTNSILKAYQIAVAKIEEKNKLDVVAKLSK